MVINNCEIKLKPFHALVNVATLLNEPIGSTRDYNIEDIADENNESPVTGPVSMVRSQRGVLVRANLTTHVEMACSRCLSPTDCVLDIALNEEFLPSIDVASGLPLHTPRDGSVFVIDHNHILDLGEAVRQYVLMAVPMKPLCRPDCAGICPTCGANLNKGPCKCRETSVDPRWAKLAALRKKPSRAVTRKRTPAPRERKMTHGTATKA
ncbi:MAG: DUF177 domain-containing protein [Chloroflexota bacterium]